LDKIEGKISWKGARVAPVSIPDHSPPCKIELKAKIAWCLLESWSMVKKIQNGVSEGFGSVSIYTKDLSNEMGQGVIQ
jgi:hypothetical protein